MWNELCEEAHEAHAMKVINRAILTIALCFLTFGGFAMATRFGAEAPPSSVSYGSEEAHKDAAVFGD